jgi:hypothetical protein
VRLPFRTALAFAGLSSAALLLASCSGDSLEKVDEDEWVQEVCDEAVDFERAFSRAGEDLSVVNDGDPDEIKDGIDEFVEAATSLIDDFVDAIEEVGEPDIDGGGDVIAAIRDHADDQKGALTTFRDDVNDLDDDDDDDFRDDVLDLLDDSEQFDLRDRFEDIDERDVDDLTDAIDEDPACSATMFNS